MISAPPSLQDNSTKAVPKCIAENDFAKPSAPSRGEEPKVTWASKVAFRYKTECVSSQVPAPPSRKDETIKATHESKAENDFAKPSAPSREEKPEFPMACDDIRYRISPKKVGFLAQPFL